MILEELRQLKNQYACFIKENRWVPWICIISVLLSYGVCLGGMRIGIDSEVIINDPDRLLDSWYSIGRYSLVWLKDLFGMRNLNPFTANLFMMVFMVLYGIFADFMFYVFSSGAERMKKFYIVFPALFLTHPCYVHQYAFTLQSFEVAICMLCCLMAVFCVSKWTFGEGRGWLIPGILLMVFGFGGYQALLPFYMSAALAVYLVYYYFHDGKKKNFYFQAALRHLAAFITGYILYSLMVKTVIIMKEGWDFKGAYLEGQILWETEPAAKCIDTIRQYMGSVFHGGSAFYPRTFQLFAILFAVNLLYVWGKERRKEYILYAAAALALVLTPFYLCFYQGSATLLRTQLSLPFTAAFFGSAVLGVLFSRRRSVSAVLMAVGLLLAVRQGNIASRSMFSAYMTYENDKMTAQQIVWELRKLDAADPDQKVAMLGVHHPSLPKGAGIREETIGYSIFEWDFWSRVGVSERGTGFLSVLGFPCQPPTSEEYEQARKYGESMPSWPSDGSVKKFGDLVVIKFSNES